MTPDNNQPSTTEPQTYADHPGGLSATDIEYAGHPEDQPAPPPVISPEAPAAPPKKVMNPEKFKKVLIISVAVGLLLLLVFGILLVILLQPKRVAKPKADTKKEVKLEPILASDTVERINRYYQGSGPASTTPTTPIRSEGFAFYSVITDTALMSSTSKSVKPADSETELGLLETMLNYQQFTKRIVKDGLHESNYLADFVRPDVTCQTAINKVMIMVDGKQKVDPEANQQVEVKCIDNKKYVELSEVQKPFFEAFSKQPASTGQSAMIGMPNIWPSDGRGYNRGELRYGTVDADKLVTNGDIAMFYQLPSKVWRFFMSKQHELFDCKVYNTSDLRLAYLNQTCINNNKKPPRLEPVKPPVGYKP